MHTSFTGTLPHLLALCLSGGIAGFMAPCPGLAQQGNCFNSGFETGTLEGWETYYGHIGTDGNLDINTPGPENTQHRIMKKEDGYDPHAFASCTQNKYLPVVAPGVGRYAIKLGDDSGGARGARIVLEFEVTPSLTFFLLRYAVLLEDPEHDYYEQPRFELYIKDSQNHTLSCGEYKVRADKNIPGFETCKNLLRVRPWTTAGFELKSYLGQTIRIEILTTDCSRGQHGGYAYIDASCRPLELTLEGYCKDAHTATYTVTQGFDAYHWSTGVSGNSITINNPVPGTPYHVTVTSSTGCSLVLSDTLPFIDVVPEVHFAPLADTTICLGESFWIKPTGENLQTPFCPELDYEADSFFVRPLFNETFTFTSKDIYGCNGDTVSMSVEVIDFDFDVVADRPCGSGELGSIEIIPTNGAPPYQYFFEGVDMGAISFYDALPLATYQIMVVDSHGCSASKTFRLHELPLPHITEAASSPAVCGENNGSIQVWGTGTGPFTYALDTLPFQVSREFTGLDSGTYLVRLRSYNGCLDSTLVHVDAYPAPEILAVTTDSATCGLRNGSITVTASGGYGTLSYSHDGFVFQEDPFLTGVGADATVVYVRDEAGCIVHAPAEVGGVSYPQITELHITDASCDEENGVIAITVDGGSPPIRYLLSTSAENTFPVFEGLGPGTYTIEVRDRIGCSDMRIVTLEASPEPYFGALTFSEQDCNAEHISVGVQVLSGLPPYRYSPDGGITWQETAVLSGLTPGEYEVMASDAAGCLLDTLITVIPIESFYLPNVFSPNGDGINDVFAPAFKAGDAGRLVIYEVFSRWGEQVYSIQPADYSTALPWWDGYDDGVALPAGVYIYHVILETHDGRRLCRSGDVTLVR